MGERKRTHCDDHDVRERHVEAYLADARHEQDPWLTWTAHTELLKHPRSGPLRHPAMQHRAWDPMYLKNLIMLWKGQKDVGDECVYRTFSIDGKLDVK